NRGPVCYFQTDLLDPRGSIIVVDLRRPEHWRVVVAAQDDGIAAAAVAHSHLLVVSHRDAHQRVAIYDLAGMPIVADGLPAPWPVTGLAGRAGEPELFLSLESFLQPPVIYRYDLGQLPVARQQSPAVQGRNSATRDMPVPRHNLQPEACNLQPDACIHQPA